jgi:hypothetical protein
VEAAGGRVMGTPTPGVNSKGGAVAGCERSG